MAGEDGNVSVLLQQEQPVNQSISETPIADRRATLSISSTRGKSKVDMNEFQYFLF